jgi:hypothetical protein
LGSGKTDYVRLQALAATSADAQRLSA